jgi:hypothetical protein
MKIVRPLKVGELDSHETVMWLSRTKSMSQTNTNESRGIGRKGSDQVCIGNGCASGHEKAEILC